MSHAFSRPETTPTSQPGSTRLRELLNRPEMLVAPGVYDGISAALAKRCGFAAGYVSGGAAAVSVTGTPDIGLMTASEMADHVLRLSAATDLPLVVDMDTGYGNELNVRHTVERLARVGTAAIHLEDQVFPKRCGHLTGKEVISAEDAAAKVRAAVAARGDSDLIVIARTDALTPLGREEAVRRAKIYADAGADMIFIESPESISDLEYITSGLDMPLMVNVLDGSRTPLLSVEEYAQLGFRMAIYPAMAAEAAVASVGDAMRTLALTGRPPAGGVGPEELFKLVGLHEWLNWPTSVGAVPQGETR